MAYVSLYRKYRPQTFADVVGQEHVTRTLQNAITSGRVAHGYLFTGTRGTAKTTVARVLAKALNCENGPASEPCNVCDACVSITGGSSMDVIEMDAASHRGVADIEEVRKAVGYGPMQLRYKVFIIDEAHQLSSDAKDAFLKTLEEPPENVVFILATTEPQAIPITIRSRCQQFDFKRGSLHDLAGRLRYVLDCENVAYTNEAVNLVARGAEGSYRDALSLLEQVLAYSPKNLSPADVDAVLGTLDTELLARLTGIIARRDAPEAFALAGEMLDAGKEARTLLRTLAAHFRDLLLVSVGGPAVAQELTPDEVVGLQAQARQFSPPQMLRALDVLNEAQAETRHNNQHRLLVELTFLKLMSLGDAAPTAHGSNNDLAASSFATAPIVFPSPALTPVPSPASGRGVPGAGAESASREALEPFVAGTPRPLAGEGMGVRAGSDETFAPDFFADDSAAPDEEDDYVPPSDDELDAGALFAAPDEDANHAPLNTAATTLAAPAALADDAATNPAADEAAEPPFVDDGPSLFDEEPPAPVVAQPAAAATVADAPLFHHLEPPPAETVEPLDGEMLDGMADEPAPAFTFVPLIAEIVADPAPPLPPAAPEPAPAAFTLDDVLRAWPRFLMEAARISKRAEIMMTGALPTGVNGRQVTIAFSVRSNYDMMSQPKQQDFVRKLLAFCLGVERVEVRYVLDPSAQPAQKSGPRPKKRPERDIVAAILDVPATAPPDGASDNGFGGGSGGNGFRVSAPPPPSRPASPLPPPVIAAAAPPRFAPGGAPTFTPPPPQAHPALDDPFVQETLSIFGGEIMDD